MTLKPLLLGNPGSINDITDYLVRKGEKKVEMWFIDRILFRPSKLLDGRSYHREYEKAAERGTITIPICDYYGETPGGPVEHRHILRHVFYGKNNPLQYFWAGVYELFNPKEMKLDLDFQKGEEAFNELKLQQQELSRRGVESVLKGKPLDLRDVDPRLRDTILTESLKGYLKNLRDFSISQN